VNYSFFVVDRVFGRDRLAIIKLLWPECPADLSQNSTFLMVRSSTKRPAIRRVTTLLNLNGAASDYATFNHHQRLTRCSNLKLATGLA
jgi:hypothetical protein